MNTPIPLLSASNGVPGQIGILVKDINFAMQHYGLPSHVHPNWRLWTYRAEIMTELIFRGKPGRFSMRIALGGTAPQIELIEPIDGPSIYHEWVQERGYGLHHVGYYVKDIRDIIAQMEGCGYTLLQAGFGFGADGTGGFAYFDTQRDLGFIIEAIEVPRTRREPEEVWPSFPSGSHRAVAED